MACPMCHVMIYAVEPVYRICHKAFRKRNVRLVSKFPSTERVSFKEVFSTSGGLLREAVECRGISWYLIRKSRGNPLGLLESMGSYHGLRWLPMGSVGNCHRLTRIRVGFLGS